MPFHLSEYPGTRAYFSILEPSQIKRAAIFVHGFAGSAEATWTAFPSLIGDFDPKGWWQGADLYFYHYGRASVIRDASRNAIDVHKFIDSVWPLPLPSLKDLFEKLGRNNFAYTDLTLVGHSLGGLLIRQVLLGAAKHDRKMEAYRELRHVKGVKEPRPKGLLKAHVRLFAPAIGGEALSGIAGIIASLPGVSLFARSSGSKTSLNAGSIAVTSTREWTERYAELFAGMDCFRAHILWADEDRVVPADAYHRDFVCRNIPVNSTHGSICKPDRSYLLPLQFVENGVDNGGC
jgi:pimeloyl-ACP methyl ester carboxylesterase